MGGLFGKPKVSKPKPVVVQQKPVEDAAETARKADNAEEQRRRASLASNLLFEQGGDAGANDPLTKKAQLLGE